VIVKVEIGFIFCSVGIVRSPLQATGRGIAASDARTSCARGLFFSARTEEETMVKVEAIACSGRGASAHAG
jgi:hypothetical protein